jgi:GT2 family glycosyltransferase
MKVSYIISTYERPEYLKNCVDEISRQSYDDYEIIVVSNSQECKDRELEILQKVEKPKKYLHSPEKMGISSARNWGFKEADGDIFVTIDDDAKLQSKEATKEIVDLFSKDDNLGILGLKVVNGFSKETEFPTPNSKLEEIAPFISPQISVNEDKYSEVPLYMGAGNAIKSEVIDDVGGYPCNFKYGVEELDLCIRTIDNEYSIKYSPDIVVIHNEKDDRVWTDRILKENYKNRISLAIRLLPIHLLIWSSLIWTGHLIYKSRGNLKLILTSIAGLLKVIPEEYDSRDTVESYTLSKMRERGVRPY